MRLLDILMFIGFINIFIGLYQFYFLYVTKKTFDIKVKEGYDGTWFRFCCESFDNWIWRFRLKSKFRWLYEGKVFVIFFRLKGIILCLIGFGIFLALFLLNKTDYWNLITVKLWKHKGLKPFYGIYVYERIIGYEKEWEWGKHYENSK